MKRVLICPDDHAAVRAEQIAAFQVALTQAIGQLSPDQRAQWAVLQPALERYWRTHPQDGTERDWLAAAMDILMRLRNGVPFERICKYAVGLDWEPLCERLALAEGATTVVSGGSV